MKVLVTGASSSIGAYIIRILLERGYPVKAFIRTSSNLSPLKGLDVEMFYGDVGLKDDLDRAIAGCSYVIHAAANMELSTGITRKQEKDNVESVEHLAKACLEHKVKRLVYISTANTIAPGSKAIPGTESNGIDKRFERSGYAKSKLMAEEVIKKFVKENNLDALILNPCFMIGPYDAKPTSNRIILQFYGKKINFIPPGGKSFIYVKDAAVAACNALMMGRSGEKYLLANDNMTFREFCDRLEEVTGQKPVKIQVPKSIVYFLGYGGSFMEKLGLKIVLTKTNAAMLCTPVFYSSEKAVKELNLPRTPIQKAISESISWLRAEQLLRR